VLYCNDGDWVESLTALVEHHDGRLEIVDRSVQAVVPQSAALAPVTPVAPLASLPTALPVRPVAVPQPALLEIEDALRP